METVVLSEWHQDPGEIWQEWTEEQFTFYLVRRNRRVKRSNRANSAEDDEPEGIQSMEQLREASRRRQLASQR